MHIVQEFVLRIRSLLIRQRSARLLLRATWTGLAGYLLAHSLAILFDFAIPDTVLVLTGLLFAAPSLAAASRRFSADRMVWQMDRLLGSQEQVTTAWQVSRQTQTTPNAIEDRLLMLVGHSLPSTLEKIKQRGWYLQQDLQALVIVSVLLITMVAFERLKTDFPLPHAESSTLPLLNQPPGFEDVFPSGIPGLTQTLPAGSSSPQTDPDGNSSTEQMNAINNILVDLGEALGTHPETADIGLALQNGDLENAAAAIERTADSVDLLPEDAREDMQRALQQAAAQAQGAGQQDLAEDLSRAAEALDNLDPNNPLTADALDELADGLRELGETFAAMGQPGQDDGSAPPENRPQVGSAGGVAGSGSGAGVAGQSEPLSRLEGEGQDFTIEGGDTPSGLLQPGSAPGSQITTTGGVISLTGEENSAAGDRINSILTPYSYPWSWRDVVSKYFSP